MPNKWRDRDTSPDRTVVWTEPLNNGVKWRRKVPVVYYLSTNNGQLQHPHFIEVPLSSTSDGLYLRDVINRLNLLRGKGMASMYSWSCKRSYKSGYVWQDLEENDFIYPANGHEYVLKGSELLEDPYLHKSDETVASPAINNSPLKMKDYGGGADFPAIRRRRHQSFDLQEYRVYKADSTRETIGMAAADASTQTDDKRHRRRAGRITEEEEEKEEREDRESQEISPPPSDSSPETLETLMKAEGGKIILRSEPVDEDRTATKQVSRKSKTKAKSKSSSVLMQFLTCGPVSFTECGPGNGKVNVFGLVSHYKGRLPRGEGSNQVEKGAGGFTVGSSSSNSSGTGKVVVEDKEYFSGSLVETKRTELPALKRSSSYNADKLR